MPTDPKLGATLLEEGTARAETLVNEMLGRILSGLMSLTSEGDTTPPGSPTNFDAYLIGASATGAWSGQDAKIGLYLDGWIFITPTEGMRVRVADTNVTIEYDGTNWCAIRGEVVLTDAANISWDASKGNHAVVTLGGNRTLDNPTNVEPGQLYTLRVIQDGTPPRTLTWGGKFLWAGGTAPTLSTGAGDVDVFVFVVSSAGDMYAFVGLDYS